MSSNNGVATPTMDIRITLVRFQ